MVRVLKAAVGFVVAATVLGGISPARANDLAFGAIEEIVVTARKREEALSQVPLSIQVFSDETIAGQGIEDIYQLADFTANFTMNKNNGRQRERPTVRGQSNVLGVPNASFFIDGAYVSSNAVVSTSMMELITTRRWNGTRSAFRRPRRSPPAPPQARPTD